MSHEGDGTPVSATDSTEVAVGSGDATRTSGAGTRRAPRLAAGARIGRYEVRAELGAGGMGVVYRAHDPELGRELAIKVVRGRHGDRLLDEARAMAKLRHGNIVPVFDVASSEHGVYVVMPLYEGGTLHDWLTAKPRPWRAVLELFLAAGRGLAAAHAAGLVHRDFKPSNVFLDANGVPLVGDFGLAAANESAEASGTSATIAGTPAYMAPEQAAGAALDARADQYAYCISMWEGLTGVRPTDAETRTRGGLGALPLPLPRTGDRGVPAWLLAAVSRGFSAMPERRWPSLDALLRHLERRRRRGRRIAAGVGAVAAAGAIAAAALVVRPGPEEPCPDPSATIAPAWSPAVASELTAALRATGLPFAQTTIDRVVPIFDAYASDWRTRQQRYCKAARVERSESADLLDARMGCLDRGLGAFRGVTTVLREDAKGTIAKAITAAERLPALADCDDREALTAFERPASPGVRAQISALSDALAAIEARRLLGQKLLALAEELNPLVVSARELDWPPVLAQALVERALALDDAGVGDAAPAREAVEAAARARDDRGVASAWLLVLGALARANKFSEAAALEAAARAAITRAGNDRDLQFTFGQRRANRAMRADQLEEAESAARELLTSATTPEEMVSANDALAVVLASRGHFDQSIPLLRESTRLAEEHYGAAHPMVDRIRVSLARNLAIIGEQEEARGLLDRSLPNLEAVYGASHPTVLVALRTLGNISKAQGDFAAARRYLERTVTALEATEDKIELGTTLGALAGVVQRIDGLEAGIPLYERALSMLGAAIGTEHQSYLGVEANLAVAYVNLEQCDQAVPRLEHARVGFAKAGMLAGNMMTSSLLATCKLLAGSATEAAALLEPLRAECLAKPCPPGMLGNVTTTLGRAIVASGDRRRGLALVREAIAIAIAERERRPADVANFKEWLQTLSKK